MLLVMSNTLGSRDSSVGIAKGYELNSQGSILGVQTGSGAHPDSFAMGTGGGGVASPGMKRQRRKADHSPPSSADVKNGGAIPPLPHTC
jgi:hypothetical protein